MKVVWTNGCFDVLHRGHIELFSFCKSIGDKVIVGIDSDEKVRLDRRKKGFNAPIDSLINRKDPQTKDRLLCHSPIFDIVKKEKIERFLHQDMKDNSLSKNLFSFVSVKLFLEYHEGWTV